MTGTVNRIAWQKKNTKSNTKIGMRVGNFLEVSKILNKLANKEKARLLQKYFKTGKGQYGEGDTFIGIMMPEQRKTSKQFKNLPLSEIQKLLNSKIHEYRMVGFLILIEQFNSSPRQPLGLELPFCPRGCLGLKGLSDKRKKIVKFYLKNTKNINNWDLVDQSSPRILGAYLFSNDRSVLYKLVKSENLWDKRISIVSTLYFISKNDFSDTLKISEILLSDKHDLVHKAVGWMLREVGKRDKKVLVKFLDKNKAKMPRTTLRYAIERFPENERKFYLK